MIVQVVWHCYQGSFARAVSQALRGQHWKSSPESLISGLKSSVDDRRMFGGAAHVSDDAGDAVA